MKNSLNFHSKKEGHESSDTYKGTTNVLDTLLEGQEQVILETEHNPIFLTDSKKVYFFWRPTLFTKISSSPHGFSFEPPSTRPGYDHPYVHLTGEICYNNTDVWDENKIQFHSTNLDDAFARNIVRTISQTRSLLEHYNPSVTPVRRLNQENFGGNIYES